jgi:hypothetical protein
MRLFFRLFFTIILPLIVAAGALGNVFYFRLSNLMREAWPPPVTNTVYAASFAILVLAFVAALLLRARWRGHAIVGGLALLVVLAVSFAPWVVDTMVTSRQIAQQQAAGADAEMQFQGDLLDRSGDVDDRIDARKPFTADEALDLLGFAADADLSWESLPDHTPEAFALIEQAIAGGILDPNQLTTTTPTADSPAETITVAFYDRRIRPVSPRLIKKHDWDVLQILVAHGADLSGEGGAAVQADLAKKITISGRFLSLQ